MGRNHPPSWRALYPFESHYLDLDGLGYHYLDEGAGNPVVMLHGNPTWSFYFRSLVTLLSPDYRVIVPDHMGCGLSEKPGPEEYDFRLENRVRDLERLLAHLDIRENITLIVHDWGGMIGLVYALRHPERIRRMVIFNTAGFLPPKGKTLPLRLRLIRDFRSFAGPAVLGLNLFARAALWMAPRKRLSKAVRAGLTAPYDRPANRLATLRFVQDIPLSPGDPSYPLVRHVDLNLRRLARTPKLILWGKHDFVFDMDYYAEWTRRCPEAERHLFEEGGHYLLEDRPEAVGRLVNDFLKKHGV